MRGRQKELRIKVAQMSCVAGGAAAGSGVVALNGNTDTHPLGKNNGTRKSQCGGQRAGGKGGGGRARSRAAHSGASRVATVRAVLRESIFSGRAIDRVIFVGGESHA